MRRLLPLYALLAACAAPVPAPSPPPAPAAPAAPEAGIATTAVTPATQAPTPMPAATPAAPAARELPPRLTSAQIDRAFDLQRRHFQALYRERAQARPALAGTVYVSFVVQPDGSVRSARIAGSSIGDPSFEQGLLKQLSLMNFPHAASPTPVERYPLVFKSQ